MDIKAIYCSTCHNIIYSRSTHDDMSCDCGKLTIDGGREYTKVSGDIENAQNLTIDGEVLLTQILYADWNFGNRYIPEEYKTGYHGKFRLVKDSSEKFYRKLIREWKDEPDGFILDMALDK